MNGIFLNNSLNDVDKNPRNDVVLQKNIMLGKKTELASCQGQAFFLFLSCMNILWFIVRLHLPHFLFCFWSSVTTARIFCQGEVFCYIKLLPGFFCSAKFLFSLFCCLQWLSQMRRRRLAVQFLLFSFLDVDFLYNGCEACLLALKIEPRKLSATIKTHFCSALCKQALGRASRRFLFSHSHFWEFQKYVYKSRAGIWRGETY